MLNTFNILMMFDELAVGFFSNFPESFALFTIYIRECISVEG